MKNFIESENIPSMGVRLTQRRFNRPRWEVYTKKSKRAQIGWLFTNEQSSVNELIVRWGDMRLEGDVPGRTLWILYNLDNWINIINNSAVRSQLITIKQWCLDQANTWVEGHMLSTDVAAVYGMLTASSERTYSALIPLFPCGLQPNQGSKSFITQSMVYKYIFFLAESSSCI